MSYKFYYDESEHSRSIGYNTITAANFYDNSITVIVGWKNDNEDAIQKRYKEFEELYLARHPNGELKSDTIQNKHLRNGFASMPKGNLGFLNDYLDLFSDNVYIHISVFSKLEFIIDQLFVNYENDCLFDMDMMKYSIIKALVIYKPRSVVDAIYKAPENVVSVMKVFFEDRIEKNKATPLLKRKETESFKQILLLLDDVHPVNRLEWNYKPPFIGFRKFLRENSIDEYALIIDREGQYQRTVKAAIEAGLKNVNDADSIEFFGIRMADMLAGMLGKLMKAICKAIHPINLDIVQKTILPNEWFLLSDEQLALYKRLHYVVCELNASWYKSFSGLYADDLVCLNALLNFMDHFENAQEIKDNLELQGEYFNGYACEALAQDYQRKRHKLPVRMIPSENIGSDYYLNQHGAKVYQDSSKQELLAISNHQRKYCVLSVGVNKDGVPLVTVEEGSKAVCYKLPSQLFEWAFSVVAVSNMGGKLFPSEVIFAEQNGMYCAEIL